eukprot:2563496-Karenia_brevis.AAC.1
MELAPHGRNFDEMKAAVMESHRTLPKEFNNDTVDKRVDSIDHTLQSQQETFLAFEERLDNKGSELHREIGGSFKESRGARHI